MAENMKNIIVFIEPSEEPERPNWKIAHLYLNRFTIDEDAAFELLGVYYLSEFYHNLIEPTEEVILERKQKVMVTNSKF